MEKNKNIFIIAGEASGDLHGAHLVNALKKIDSNLNFNGAGGHLMKKAGVNLYYNLADISVVGFWEVIKNLKKFKAVFKLLCKKLDELNPDAVILIDYPGFNLRFAEEVKKRNVKLIYYISPQVWAWGKKRIELIKKCVDKMLVIFKFEEELYKSCGVNATFIGHPLLDIVKPSSEKAKIFKELDLSPEKKTIALLPGSRESEVKRHLPLMLETAKIIQEKLPQAQFILSRFPTLCKNLFHSYITHYTCLADRQALNIKQLDNSYDCISAADFVLVASGTATLETAILEKPMAIIYKTSFLTWLIAKSQIKIPYIGLVNVVLGKKAVPEFIQYGTRPKEIAKATIDLLNDQKKLDDIKNSFLELKEILGKGGASENAARIILEFI